MQPLNISDHFFRSAGAHPQRIAIAHRDRVITFGELAKDVRATASYYHAKGLRKGDRVLVFVPMSIELYRCVLALFHIGATAVFLDEWVSKERLEICCRIADCKGFIGIPKARLLALFSKELRRIPVKLGPKFRSAPAFTPEPVSPDDTALITFTTGSTGTPKAAKRTHGFLQEQFSALTEKVNPQPDDVDMPVLPIVLLLNLGTAVPSIIAEFKASKPATLQPEKVVEQIRRFGVNRMTSSPYFVHRLAQHLLQTKQTLPLRKIFTGGAPVFPREAATLAQAFPDSDIQIVYGSTEAEPISTISAHELKLQAGQALQGLDVGIPYRKTEVLILPIVDAPMTAASEEELKSLALPVGQAGEIVVSGPHVLREYLHNPEALKRNKIFIGDKVWHRTGDAGYRDASGRLFLCGRCSTMIARNNGWIFPFLVEEQIAGLRGYGMGTVLEVNGQVLLIAETNSTEKDQQGLYALAESLGLEKNAVKEIASIPRDPRHHSKIDYEKLRQQIR